MTAQQPQVILRLGSHAEKEYVEKTLRHLDGLMLGANLLEATPGATASLILKCGTQKPPLPVFVDPMTYAFGRYVDPATQQTRTDLDWIKSDQKVKGAGPERRFKRSYLALGTQYGGAFEEAIERSVAISAAQLQEPKVRRLVVDGVIGYQLSRARQEFEGDPEFENLADLLPAPAALFAPYFYIEPSTADAWLSINLQLAHEAAERHGTKRPIHAIVCADAPFLSDDAFRKRLVSELPHTGIAGVWLWFSRLAEDSAPLPQLRAYRSLIEALSDSVGVFVLHGGFYSLALSRVGVRGISHGVGYGEQKDVMPVIGQSVPTVRYYAPPMGKKLGVPEIERSFPRLGVTSPAEFLEHVCDCSICKGVLGNDLRNFSQFGDMRYSTPESRRKAQTPTAAKLCRFHFLLARFKEREWLRDASLSDIRTRLASAFAAWTPLQAIEASDKAHLERWQSALQ